MYIESTILFIGKISKTFFASQYCNLFQKVSSKDFLAIELHYSEYVKMLLINLFKLKKKH